MAGVRSRAAHMLLTVAVAAALAVPVVLSAPVGASAAAQDDGSGVVRFMTSGDPAEQAAYESLVAAFEAQHPEIDVQVEHVASEDDYLQRLAADFAAGTPADVIFLNYRRFASFAARGVLEPLGPRFTASSVLTATDFAKPALDAFRFRGDLVCLPQNVSSLVVYYDKDLFDAAGLPYPTDGWTWDDFLATAMALTKDLDRDGTTDQYGLGVDPQLVRVAPFIWQHGGELVVSDSNGRPLRLAVDSPAAAAAIEWFTALQTEHHVVPDRTAETAQDSESRFIDGRTAMFLQSRRPTPAFREISAFDWDVAPLPREIEEASVLHSDGFCMPAKAANKDAAWTLIEFANSVEGQTILAGTGRTVPSLTQVAASPAFLDPEAKPAHSQVWLDAIPTIRAVPTAATWLEVEEIANEELERAFYGDVPVAEAIATLVSRTTPLFAGEEGQASAGRVLLHSDV
jgi:multiple sugar transport system substrate-binding protein